VAWRGAHIGAVRRFFEIYIDSAASTRRRLIRIANPSSSIQPEHSRALQRRIPAAAVNLPEVRASTSVMAAGTMMDTVTMATAEESAAQEFSSIVATHRPQIFRFLLASTRDPDLAETLTQDCFLKAHRNWASFRGESSAMTWLMRIAINLQKDHWRNRRMQFWRLTRTNSVDVDEAGDWLPSRESSAEARLLAREQVERVWQAVKGLSERQRTVFLLRHVEEMELGEIARSTGLSEGTVKAHLSRALARVRAEVGGKR
jgi:RNA polymerase sigma-70 factor, ECF subfamily